MSEIFDHSHQDVTGNVHFRCDITMTPKQKLFWRMIGRAKSILDNFHLSPYDGNNNCHVTSYCYKYFSPRWWMGCSSIARYYGICMHSDVDIWLLCVHRGDPRWINSQTVVEWRYHHSNARHYSRESKWTTISSNNHKRYLAWSVWEVLSCGDYICFGICNIIILLL